ECGCTKALTRRGGSPRRAGMTVGNAGRKTRARRVVRVPRRARTSAGIRPGHTDAFIFGGHDIGVVSAPSLIDIEVEGLRQVVEGHVRTGEVHEGVPPAEARVDVDHRDVASGGEEHADADQARGIGGTSDQLRGHRDRAGVSEARVNGPRSTVTALSVSPDLIRILRRASTAVSEPRSLRLATMSTPCSTPGSFGCTTTSSAVGARPVAGADSRDLVTAWLMWL